MVEFLKDHVVMSLIAAYVFGQLTAVLVLGVLVPRDPADDADTNGVGGAHSESFGRRRARRPSAATTARTYVRTSLSNRLRRYIEREEPANLN